MTWRIECGDCLELLKALPDKSVDAVVTDPPYGVGYKYNGAFDDTEENFVGHIVPLLCEMLRVSRGAVLWFGASTTMMRDMPLLKPQRVLAWAPKFSLSGSRKDGVFYKWHPIYSWNLPKKQDGFARDVLDDSTGGRNWWNHPATKPIPLMEKLCKVAIKGGTVLDPFAGSGTTGVACVQTGRNFIGFEIDPHYCEIARKRIGEAESKSREIIYAQ